jgi:hypothetical protein
VIARGGPREPRRGGDRPSHPRDVARGDQDAAVFVQQLWQGAAREGADRRPASERLGHDEAVGLVPARRDERRGGLAHQPVECGMSQVADVLDARSRQPGTYLGVVVAVVCNRPGEHERPTRKDGRVDRQVRSLLRCDTAEPHQRTAAASGSPAGDVDAVVDDVRARREV